MATVKDLVNAFMRWKGGENKKPNSLRQYSTRLKPLVAKFGSREFDSLTPLEIAEHVATQSRFTTGKKAGQVKAPDTRRQDAIALNMLQEFALKMKVVKEPIFDKLKKPKGRKRKRIPTDAEIEQITKHSSPEFGRIYRGLLGCGARPHELAQAEMKHWDKTRGRSGGGMIVFQEEFKTEEAAEERRIAVGRKLLPLFLEAAGDRSEGPIFLTPQGKTWTSKTLTQTFSRARTRAGLPKDLLLYLVRHRHITLVVKAKGIYAGKDAGGHKSIMTTQGYVHTEDEDLQAVQDSINEAGAVPDTSQHDSLHST